MRARVTLRQRSGNMWQWLVDANDLQADLDLDNDVDLKDYAKLADTWLDVLLWP